MLAKLGTRVSSDSQDANRPNVDSLLNKEIRK